MTTFVVASKANQPYLSECQILGEHLMTNCPDVEVKFVIKDSTEWPQFIQSVCRSYGFVQKSSTVVYTLEGKLIGDGRNFIEYVRDHFDTQVSVTKEQQKRRTALNIKENEERITKMKDGESMAERIEIYMDKVKKKKVAQLIDDCYYEEHIEKGVPFQVRRSNFLRDMPVSKKPEKHEEEKEEYNLNLNKTLNVPDEVLKREVAMEQAALAEAQRDKTFEEFEAMYSDHIAGKVDPAQRVAGRPVTAGFEDGGGSRSGSAMGHKQGSGGAGDADQMDVTSSKRDRSVSKEGRSQASRSQKNASKMSSRSRMTNGSDKIETKYEISKECKLQFLKANKIEEFDDDYVLAVHPYPQIEGELLLFQIDERDQDDHDEDGNEVPSSGVIVYRDYSLMKRIETDPKEVDMSKMTALEKKKYMEADQAQTKLQCLEQNNVTLLSSADWSYFCNLLLEVQGLGWVQTLPVGQKSSQPLQFNMMHILPSSKIPFTKVPLDVMISNKLNFQKKRDKRMKEGMDMKNVRQHRPVHERDEEAEEAGLVLLDEYPFPHAVHMLDDGELTVEGLKYGFKKIITFLGLHDNLEAGLTLIVAPQWMFLAPMYQPYHVEKDANLIGEDLEEGLPLYHDGFAYAGVLNIQDIVQVWPETTGIGFKEHTALDSLVLQCTPKEIQ